MLYTIYMEAISFTRHKKLLLPEESRNRIERIFHIAQEKKAGQTTLPRKTHIKQPAITAPRAYKPHPASCG